MKLKNIIENNISYNKKLSLCGMTQSIKINKSEKVINYHNINGVNSFIELLKLKNNDLYLVNSYWTNAKK